MASAGYYGFTPSIIPSGDVTKPSHYDLSGLKQIYRPDVLQFLGGEVDRFSDELRTLSLVILGTHINRSTYTTVGLIYLS